MVPKRTIHTATAFTCPFCGRQAGVSTHPSAVIHALPMCAKFDQLEPADYLAAVNAQLARAALELN